MDWKTAVLTAIYRKGDTADPKNYRLIAVLSHARKFVEAAITMAIRQKYTVSPFQLGFQPNNITKTAIMQDLYAAKVMSINAILDLRAAYDSVPRNLMLEVMRKRIGPNLTKIGAMTLQPLVVKSKLDKTDQRAKIKKGVP